MNPLSEEAKQVFFGSFARAKASTATVKKTTTTTTTKRRVVKKAPAKETAMPANTDGGPLTPDTTKKTKTTKTTRSATTKKTKPPTKMESFFKKTNQIGLASLALTSVANHAVNTTFKAIAAVNGGDVNYYNEKSKTYLKPSFAIPAQWHHPKITFGTPWFY